MIKQTKFVKLSLKNNLTKRPDDYSSLVVDMHSHVLPGIDDGAQTPEDSIILIKKMQEWGLKKIIATPHIMADHYKNNVETITNALDQLNEKLASENITVIIEAAAEHYLDERFEDMISKRQLITMGDNFVLFEIPFISKPSNLMEMIVKMTQLNYKPILAHPERHLYLKLADYKSIKLSGCSLQVNTISLTGYYGKDVKRNAERLADNQLIDFISSDMHHLKHAVAFEEALKMPYVKNLLSSNNLKNYLLA